jgi:hypothetical protein
MPNSEGWARFLFVVSLAGDRAEPRAHPPIPKRVGPEFGPLRRGVLSPKPTFRKRTSAAFGSIHSPAFYQLANAFTG